MKKKNTNSEWKFLKIWKTIFFISSFDIEYDNILFDYISWYHAYF